MFSANHSPTRAVHSHNEEKNQLSLTISSDTFEISGLINDTQPNMSIPFPGCENYEEFVSFIQNQLDTIFKSGKIYALNIVYDYYSLPHLTLTSILKIINTVLKNQSSIHLTAFKMEITSINNGANNIDNPSVLLEDTALSNPNSNNDSTDLVNEYLNLSSLLKPTLKKLRLKYSNDAALVHDQLEVTNILSNVQEPIILSELYLINNLYPFPYLSKYVEQKQSDSLVKLSIQGACLDARFSTALLCKKQLQTLNLKGNFGIAQETKALAEALYTNSSLTHLNLSSNNLKDDAIIPFKETLEKNHSLSLLKLDDNDISNVGAKSLSEALQKNDSLTYLGLSENRLTPQGEQQLISALFKNKTLNFLTLNNNNARLKDSYWMPSHLDSRKMLNKLFAVNYSIMVIGSENNIYSLNSKVFQKQIPLGYSRITDVPLLPNDAHTPPRLSSQTSTSASSSHMLPPTVRSFPLARPHILHDDSVLPQRIDQPISPEELHAKLVRNKDTQIRLRYHWSMLAVVIAFMRANKNHSFSMCIVPLLPAINAMTSYFPIKGINTSHIHFCFFKKPKESSTTGLLKVTKTVKRRFPE